ncbi:MAG: hypothetical protein HQ488_02885 [Parcubacteria group bacterium]|nr:hypothetical protein [Parcubacteria group bacterium]
MDINNLNLEKFTGYGSKTSRKISITKSFSFGLPPAFYQENELDKFNFALLLFDKDNKVIAIKFAENDSDGGFKLATYGEGKKRGATFVARSFFNNYNIDPKLYSGRYEYEKINSDEHGQVFLIKIEAQDIET